MRTRGHTSRSLQTFFNSTTTYLRVLWVGFSRLLCAAFRLSRDALNAGALEQTVAAASPVVALVYEKPARHTRPSYIYASRG